MLILWKAVDVKRIIWVHFNIHPHSIPQQSMTKQYVRPKRSTPDSGMILVVSQ
jgi:hypothetical protein